MIPPTASVPFRVLKLARQIQQIPAPTFCEAERAEFVQTQLDRAGLLDVGRDELNNLYARMPGLSPGSAPVLVTAHLDTVFPSGTNLSLTERDGRLSGPGIGDNSLGVAGLLGLVWWLQAEGVEPPGDVWLAANVGEEGLGDMRGMRVVVGRLGSRARAIVVLEGMALGHVYHRGIGVRRFQISVKTEGGHSWLKFGRPSAVHTLMRLGAQLADLRAPSAPGQPRTTYNIGVIEGGTSVNTIASRASLQLDLRSEDPAELDRLCARVVELAGSHRSEEIEVELRVIGDRPAGEIGEAHPLVQLALESLRDAGVAQPALEAGSTDANYPLSLGLPCVCLGLTRGGDAHTESEYIETEPLEQGLRALAATVLGAFQI